MSVSYIMSFDSLPCPFGELLSGDKSGSFAVPTLKIRVPATIENIRKDVAALVGTQTALKQEEVKIVCDELAQISDDLKQNSFLQLFSETSTEFKQWNEFIMFWRKKGKAGTLNVPWLLTECYVYKRIFVIVTRTRGLKSWDPFEAKKQASWWSCVSSAVVHGQTLTKSVSGLDSFLLYCNFALWGNRADLSLHATVDTAAAAVSASNADKLLVNDLPAVWQYLSSSPNPSRRIDIVLDNAGIELFADLCLADWFVSSKCADSVILHVKAHPWFVSDVTPRDVDWILAAMDGKAAPAKPQPSSQHKVLQSLSARWQGFLSSRKWIVEAHPFWTTPFPFWYMPALAPDLYQHLSASRLIIFKGDLNYRKLLFDAEWDPATPLREVVGPFAPAPFLALRTNKADVIAGLPQGMAEELDRSFPERSWMVSGEFGVAQFFASQVARL